VDKLDPNENFSFNGEVRDRVKSLLDVFKSEEIVRSEMTPLSFFDVLSRIVIEAMQHCDMIPTKEETEVAELELQVRMITEMKHSLERTRACLI